MNVLAHQNGWDELLLAAGPVVLITLVVWWLSRHDPPVDAPEGRTGADDPHPGGTKPPPVG